jgi:hypothetical protein
MVTLEIHRRVGAGSCAGACDRATIGPCEGTGGSGERTIGRVFAGLPHEAVPERAEPRSGSGPDRRRYIGLRQSPQALNGERNRRMT